jgi:putative two-component system response regulator
MVTALRDVEDRVKALEAGADDFLSKPVDKVELLARVKSLLKIKTYYDSLYKSQKQLEEEVLVKSNQMKKAYENAKQASLETVIRLSKAAEYKDEETGAHIRRISHYAAALSRKIGLSDEMVEIILYAAPMHDIGKIGIPEKILLKQGSLDPDEWDIMKQHTTIGAQILHGSKADFIRFAEIIAFTHHEKWDGTGYPQGLKGTDIPLIGRIVAIVDVFDALTTKRPYRDALSVEDSLNFIIERRGTHFDPNMVDAFLEIKDDILGIKAQFKENQESLLIQLTEKKYKSPLITNKAMSMFK